MMPSYIMDEIWEDDDLKMMVSVGMSNNKTTKRYLFKLWNMIGPTPYFNDG